jgi:hypothetical protein
VKAFLVLSGSFPKAKEGSRVGLEGRPKRAGQRGSAKEGRPKRVGQREEVVSDGSDKAAEKASSSPLPVQTQQRPIVRSERTITRILVEGGGRGLLQYSLAVPLWENRKTSVFRLLSTSLLPHIARALSQEMKNNPLSLRRY